MANLLLVQIRARIRLLQPKRANTLLKLSIAAIIVVKVLFLRISAKLVKLQYSHLV